MRNALFRGAPSLSESDPGILGPLAETMVQTVLRGHNLQVHFFRDYEDPGNRRSTVREVDFVLERIDGETIPVEVKFRKHIDVEDVAGIRHFMGRFRSPLGMVVTRQLERRDPEARLLYIPLRNFLLAF